MKMEALLLAHVDTEHADRDETQTLHLTWLSQGRFEETQAACPCKLCILGCATDSQPRKGELWKWKLFLPVIIHLYNTLLLLFVRFLYVCLWLVYDVLL